jgi:hypothetical protein
MAEADRVLGTYFSHFAKQTTQYLASGRCGNVAVILDDLRELLDVIKKSVRNTKA